MKTTFVEILLLITIGTIIQGCAAAIPFLPMLASAPSLLMAQLPFRSHPAESKPIAQDPELQQAIIATPRIAGDKGVDIAQQDRVSFQPASEGSIPMRVGAVDIVSDVKARSVGDIVTVNVVESMSSESKASTSLAHKGSISGGIPNLLSGTEWLGLHHPQLNINSLVSASSDSSSSGSGAMSAGDTFTATVSSIVVAVNPSGTLSIRGDRHVRVNGENDTIRLSGVVRPDDLDSNNMVSSSLVANLEVSMVGEGQIRDKQGNGVGTRMFDWLWPF
jgi:flagellar L-ring protein precursor FlgH